MCPYASLATNVYGFCFGGIGQNRYMYSLPTVCLVFGRPL